MTPGEKKTELHVVKVQQVKESVVSGEYLAYQASNAPTHTLYERISQ